MTEPDPSADETDCVVIPPVVVHLGHQGRGRVRRLKGSFGPLTHDVVALAARLGEEARPDDPRDVVPVVLLYRLREDGFAEPVTLDRAARDEPA